MARGSQAAPAAPDVKPEETPEVPEGTVRTKSGFIRQDN